MSHKYSEDGYRELEKQIEDAQAENAELREKLANYLEIQALEMAHNELIPKLKLENKKLEREVASLHKFCEDKRFEAFIFSNPNGDFEAWKTANLFDWEHPEQKA